MYYFHNWITLTVTWNNTKIYIHISLEIHVKQSFEQHNSFWQLSPMPAAKALSGLVPVKGTLYAVGGILQNSYATRELMSYNIERDTWTMLPQMKEVRYDPGKQKRKNPLVMNSKNRKFLCSNEILKLPKTFLSVSKGLILYFVNSLVKLSKQTKKWGFFLSIF